MFHWALACFVMQYDALSRGKVACNHLKARKSKDYFGLLDAPLGGAKYTRLYGVPKFKERERERQRERHARHAFFPERKQHHLLGHSACARSCHERCLLKKARSANEE